MDTLDFSYTNYWPFRTENVWIWLHLHLSEWYSLNSLQYISTVRVEQLAPKFRTTDVIVLSLGCNLDMFCKFVMLCSKRSFLLLDLQALFQSKSQTLD